MTRAERSIQSLPSDKHAGRITFFFLSLLPTPAPPCRRYRVRHRHIGCCLCLWRCRSGSAPCLGASGSVRGYAVWRSPCAVWSSGWWIAFLLRCYDLLHFIKNECEPGIECGVLGGFIQCTWLFFMSYFHRGKVFSPPRLPGGLADLFAELFPHCDPLCMVHLCYCYFLCWPSLLAGLCRFMELLLFSILASRREDHAFTFRKVFV